MANYAQIRDGFGIFDLLKEIKGHTFKLTDQDYPHQMVWDSYQTVFNTRQGKTEFLDKFQERFNIMKQLKDRGAGLGQRKFFGNRPNMEGTYHC